MFRTLCCLLVSGSVTLSAVATSAVLQTFTAKDHLGHAWTDEIVHFPIAYTGTIPKLLTLTDAAGSPAPCQVADLTRKNGQVTGTLWTVVSLPPKGTVTLHLGKGKLAPTALRLETPQGEDYLLANEFLTLRLPCFAKPLAQPVPLTSLPAAFGKPTATLDGKPAKLATGAAGAVVLDLPEGEHRFTLAAP